jgi:glycosyltransferase involved in cell wall biosynthesis
MEKICFLYKNKSICKQMGKSSKLRVQEFTWQRYEEQILKVYKKVIQLEGINK